MGTNNDVAVNDVNNETSNIRVVEGVTVGNWLNLPHSTKSPAGLPITPCKLENLKIDTGRNTRPKLNGKDIIIIPTRKDDEPQAGSSSKKRSRERCLCELFSSRTGPFFTIGKTTKMSFKLTEKCTYEAENPFEVSLKESFLSLESQLKPPFSLKIPIQEEYLNLNRAILYAILTETHLAKNHIKHLHGKITDGYEYFTSLVIKIVNELYTKLVVSVKRSLLWVTRELVNVLAVGFDGLLVALMRQIVGGDFGDENLWLCYEMVGIFSGNWDCLFEEEPLVMTSGLYVFLRLLADHCRELGDAKIESLRKMEIGFCVRMLREKFGLCLSIGRDLVRLLQDLIHVREFHTIWKDLLYHPSAFGTDEFVDISQIYRKRTSSRYFLLRITPEMESQLRFLLTHVKFGCQKRYQVWFAKKFLALPEKNTVVIDIVRFICCAHHPSNEIIQSGIIPRWAIIGWLLKSGLKNYVEANAKLALFYDWLFFDGKVDNIMNVEPAILLMVHSIPQYIDVTHSLLEFLFMVLDNYDIERKEIVLKGVSNAFRTLVKNGVVQSLDIVTKCDALSPFLKERLAKLLSGVKLNPNR